MVTDGERRGFAFPETPGAEIVSHQAMSEEELPESIEQADALVVDRLQVTAKTIARLKKCKIIVRMGIGFDNVDGEAAGKQGIPVCTVPDYCLDEVADHAIALLLSLTRNVVTYNRRILQKKQWAPRLEAPNWRLRGKRLGLVGVGAIGKGVAVRAKALGMEVAFYDPYVDSVGGVEKVETIEELARTSDVVSFHVPLTPETRHLADETFFSQLKKGSFLINVGRGGVIKTEALHRALNEGVVGKAALDVLEQEPINYEHALFRSWLEDPSLQERLIITPHAAFHSAEAEKDIAKKAMENILSVLGGKEPRNCVNGKHLES